MVLLLPGHRALARSYLRHLGRLPDPVTRAYLLNLLHKRCRRPHGQDRRRVAARVAKTVSFIENVRLKIAAANSGHVEVFEELLKEAFARTGERRDQLLKLLAENSSSPPSQLSYPSTEFPTYSPALVALLTSPEAYPARNRPSQSDLQGIPLASLITNTWSDLPHQLQDIQPPKSPHMGMLHEARQINKRRALYKRWLAGLVGPPLVVPENCQKNFPPSVVAQSASMISELQAQAAKRGPSGTPRYAGQSAEPSAVVPPPRRPHMRIPAHLPATHPLHPTPPPADVDPLSSSLSKRQRPKPPPSPVDLSKGPRKPTMRLFRRRYQSILSQVPVIESVPTISKPRPTLLKDTDGCLVDRTWIAPSSTLLGQGKYIVKRAGDELGTVGSQDMDLEDLAWMPPP